METQSKNTTKITTTVPIEDEIVSTLLKIIKTNAKPENILEKINPKLKILYDNRVINYDKKDELENSWCKTIRNILLQNSKNTKGEIKQRRKASTILHGFH
jgi:hypothetical protein